MSRNNKKKRFIQRAFSANCGACGAEHSVSELTKTSFICGWHIPLCNNCLNNDVVSDYKQAAELIPMKPEDSFISAARILKERKMPKSEEPNELKYVVANFEDDWGVEGLVSVSSGYGLPNMYDGPDKACWIIYAYAEKPKDLKNILPGMYHGYPVQIRQA